MTFEEDFAAIGRRVNPGGVKEVTIRQYGPQQIEIIIPKAGDEIVLPNALFRIVKMGRNRVAVAHLTLQAPLPTQEPDGVEQP